MGRPIGFAEGTAESGQPDEVDGPRGWDPVARQLFTFSPVAMGTVGLDGTFFDVNPALCSLLQRTEAELQSLTFQELTHPDDIEADLALLAELAAGERDAYRLRKRYVRADGDEVWADLSVSVVRDEYGAPRRYVSQILDLTADRAAHEALSRLAARDPLTGLVNRRHTFDAVEAELAGLGEHDVVGVLCVGLDGLKAVNDASGWAGGDRLLVAAAERLTAVVGSRGTVGRVSGAEFVVVLRSASSTAAVESVADEIDESFAAAGRADGEVGAASVSIGMVVASAGTTDADRLVRAADAARSRARRLDAGRWTPPDPGGAHPNPSAIPGPRLAEDAIGGVFTAWFQPIMELGTGSMIGHEALVRWDQHERQILTPAQFMPDAESEGLSPAIDLTVLDQACRRLAADPRGLVSVNISAGFLALSFFGDRVRAVLERHGVDPGRLVLELSEPVVLGLPRSVRRQLEGLDANGVRLFVDDFGSGYGALSVLDDLPISGVKLGRGRTADVGRGGRAAEVAAGLVSLLATIGLVGVVEGIETIEELNRLETMGWSWGQGYLLGAPEPPDPG